MAPVKLRFILISVATCLHVCQETPHGASAILRLSNQPSHGVPGVGPQWHADGAFERRIFSHVLFHAVKMPERGGGGTEMTDLGAAFRSLPAHKQRAWSQLATVNAFSGVDH